MSKGITCLPIYVYSFYWKTLIDKPLYIYITANSLFPPNLHGSAEIVIQCGSCLETETYGVHTRQLHIILLGRYIHVCLNCLYLMFLNQLVNKEYYVLTYSADLC